MGEPEVGGIRLGARLGARGSPEARGAREVL